MKRTETQKHSEKDREIQHTPTPWTMLANVSVTVGIPGKGAIAVLTERETQGGLVLDREIAKANAAFIVRAVNSHEELVKAVKEASKMHPMNVQFKQVLAKAEGKGE